MTVDKSDGKILKIFLVVVALIFVGALVYIQFFSSSLHTSSLFPDNLEPSADVNQLDSQIQSTDPENTSETRLAVLHNFDEFIKTKFKDLTTPPGYQEIYMLLKTRIDRTIKEINEANVPLGELKLWYIYNMGVIAKTSDATIGFDLAGTYVYPSLVDLGGYVDMLLISHTHGDHFDKNVIMNAEEHGATIIIPDGKVRVDYNGLTPFIVKDPDGVNMLDALRQIGIDTSDLTAIKPNETIKVKGVSVTAFSGEHRSPSESAPVDDIYDTPVDWYYVNLSGFGLLHTGDGFLFGNIPDFSTIRVDVYIIHYTDGLTCEMFYKMVPNASIMMPLHLHELGHGRDIFGYGMFKNALDQYNHGYLTLNFVQPNPTPMRYVPMMWGESLEIRKSTQ
jgi:L-ascorbate metabolism protein UlaG (beta-lactamase superfamily)